MSTSNTPSTGTKPWNDVNEVKIIGRIGGSPEVRITSKSQVAKTTLYLTNEYDNKQGKRVKNTTRVPVLFFGDKAASFANDVGKGDAVQITGRLQESKWQDSETQQTHSRLEVVGFEYEVKKKAAQAA